jgi:TolB protein
VKAEDVHTGNYLDVIGQPAWSSDGSRIAFVCPLEGRSGLCVTDSDGSDAVHLRLGSAEQDRLPAWSRDGQIAFARQFDNKDAAIYLTDPDEPEVRQLTEGYFDFNPTWAPDGEQIAFIRRINDEYDIYLMNEDGSSSRPLKRTAGAEGNVVWAPDGERLAYIIGEPEQDVYVTDLETLNRRNITQSSDPEGWPTWSPDGRRLAFMCGPGTGICVINADGTGRRQIVDGATLNMQPAWQPT